MTLDTPPCTIAFFPYKASMWDSMESIWRAAATDPRCKAVVVPIPYFDRNKDHSFGAMHYEGEQFPEYVPVIHYSRYDLNLVRPDIAYIHNPFDGNNFISSVHPDYYSPALKQYVKKLVYVPYYANVHSQDSLCAIVSETSVDIVIAQSHIDAEIFAAYNPGKTIAALGSPKLDKTLEYLAQPPAMPDAWRSYARRKAFFFLNTSLSAMLAHGGRFFQKLRWLFDFFAQNDDFALLWRPHPLSGAALSSLNPDLLREYSALLHDFRKSSIGILDESEDAQRAIALTDAYLGERSSSLYYLYMTTGKPAFLLDYALEVPQEDIHSATQMTFFTSMAVAQANSKSAHAVLAGQHSTLYPLHPERSDEEFVPKEPHLPLPAGYTELQRAGDGFVFISRSEKRIALLDEQCDLLRLVELPSFLLKKGAGFEYLAGDARTLFFTRRASHVIYSYDLHTQEWRHLTGWHRHLSSLSSDSRFLGLQPGVVVDGCLFLPCGSGALSLCPQSGKAAAIEILDHATYDKVVADGERLLLYASTTRGGKQLHVASYGPQDGSIRKFVAPGVGGEQLSLVPFAHCLVVVDKKNGIIHSFTGDGQNCREIASCTPVSSYFQHGTEFSFADRISQSELLICNFYTLEAFIINITTGGIIRKSLMGKEQSLAFASMKMDPYQHPYVFSEHTKASLLLFTALFSEGAITQRDIKQKEYFSSLLCNHEGSSGKAIHQFAVEQL